MSEAATALGGASFTGFVLVEELEGIGMITFRGDLSTPVLAEVTGIKMPEARGIAANGSSALGWMSPDEALLVLPRAEVSGALRRIGAAMAGQHHLAVDVSDARAAFRVGGPNAREVLAKLAPVDLSPAAFRPGELRRTRLAQVPAAFWMSGGNEFTVVCFRSVARYVFNLLASSAAPGSEVNAY